METSEQRLGIADKKFDLKDIIYLRCLTFLRELIFQCNGKFMLKYFIDY